MNGINLPVRSAETRTWKFPSAKRCEWERSQQEEGASERRRRKPGNGKERATIWEVARVAGVSHQTVSRYLKNEGGLRARPVRRRRRRPTSGRPHPTLAPRRRQLPPNRDTLAAFRAAGLTLTDLDDFSFGAWPLRLRHVLGTATKK